MTRRLLMILLIVLASPAPAQQLPEATVWLPPPEFRQWSGLDSLLRERGAMKLTIGLSPAMATPIAKATLAPWIDKGRVEVAARIDGDPVLTVITRHPAAPRPQDTLERAVETREGLEKHLGLAPAGFIPGAGAVDAPVAAALGASGADWVLAGPYAAPEAPWRKSGRAILVPSGAVRLYDESASTTSVFLASAADLPRPVRGWTTVGDLVRANSPAAAEPSEAAAWPAWDALAAVPPPVGSGGQAAWDAYGAAALTLERYQNSGSADLGTLDAAVALLRRAQAARFYIDPENGDLPRDMRAALLQMYKKLKLPAPDALYGAPVSTGSASLSDDRPASVKALSGPSWLEFRAPAGTVALAPSLSSGARASIADGGAAADPWRIRGLRAEWDENAVRLILRVGKISTTVPRPIYEVYMDFNHVLGAGRISLLEGRGAFVPARDAWELALSIVGDEARLYRARGGGEPEETGVFKIEWAPNRGEAAVIVPRAFMRGNPARWGWAVVALAEDSARPGRRPAASLVGPDGTILLGALAPANLQKAILSRANSRVPASRLEP